MSTDRPYEATDVELVTASLPVDPDDGSTVVEWRAERVPDVGDPEFEDVRYLPVWGPPEQVGVAVLDRLVASGRWLRLDPDEPHLIEFRPDGWTIQHPVRCRPNLFACEVNRVGESLDGPSGPPPEGLGVYECWLDDGDFVIGGRRDG